MKKRSELFMAAAAPIVCLGIFLSKDVWIGISRKFPKCAYHLFTGRYCPGCGNTRSVIALLHGDILGSIQNNIAPIIIALVLVLLYVELIFRLCGKEVKILPRKSIFWWIFGGCMLLYYVVRNFVDVMAPVDI